MTWSVPIIEGYAFPHAIQQLQIGGDDLTFHLQGMLQKRGISVPKEIVRDIKERLGVVSPGVDEIISAKGYKLPDGQEIILDPEERVKVTEPLFTPSLLGLSESDGIHSLIHTSVTEKVGSAFQIYIILIFPCIQCWAEQRHLYGNMVLSGSSLFPGLSERIQNELNKTNAYPKEFIWDGQEVPHSLRALPLLALGYPKRNTMNLAPA